jgi:hypothetical protein
MFVLKSTTTATVANSYSVQYTTITNVSLIEALYYKLKRNAMHPLLECTGLVIYRYITTSLSFLPPATITHSLALAHSLTISFTTTITRPQVTDACTRIFHLSGFMNPGTTVRRARGGLLKQRLSQGQGTQLVGNTTRQVGFVEL